MPHGILHVLLEERHAEVPVECTGGKQSGKQNNPGQRLPHHPPPLLNDRGRQSCTRYRSADLWTSSCFLIRSRSSPSCSRCARPQPTSTPRSTIAASNHGPCIIRVLASF